MIRYRIPARRPVQRFYRFRPGRKKMLLRFVFSPQNLLLLASALLLICFAAWLGRSRTTAAQNRRYEQWHETAEEAAEVTEASAARPAAQFQRMTKPDGSAITKEYKQQNGLTVSDTVASAKYHAVSGNVLPEMAALRAKNRDLAAWITIEGVIDLPIVYRDNSWYLNHNFEGEKSASGTLFLDQNSPVAEKTQNLLIHGHNMKDGSMFAQIIHYRKKDYWQKHPFITLSTLWEKEDYVVFTVLDVPDRPDEPGYVNYFSHAVFPTDDAFREYMEQVRDHSVIPSYLTVAPEDALLTLSTCIGDHHLVVLARRIRKDENRQFLKSLL